VLVVVEGCSWKINKCSVIAQNIPITVNADKTKETQLDLWCWWWRLRLFLFCSFIHLTVAHTNISVNYKSIYLTILHHTHNLRYKTI
jgi:hypothetical protein